MVYSLADYILAIKLPDSFAVRIGLEDNSIITVGGEGSYLDSMSVEYDNDFVSTKGDSTGSWVHSKNLSLTGKVTISISQVSEKSALFRKVINLYRQSNVKDEGLQLSLQDSFANELVSGEDCYFVKIPNLDLKSEADNQSWELTCGRIVTN